MLHTRHPQARDMVTVVLLAAVALAVLGELTVWIPVAAPLAHTYGRTAASSTGWVFGVTMALGVLVTGPLADRYGRRPVLLAGLAVLAVASLAAGAAPSWPVHLTARAAQGLAAATFPPVVLAWIAEALPAARRVLATTVVVTAMQAATPVGQLYGQWVTAGSGWRATYLGLAAAYLVACWLLSGLLLPDTPVVEQAERAGQTARRLLGILSVRPLWACWLLSGLLPGVVVAMYAGLQLRLPAVSSAPADLLMAARIAGLTGILAAPLLLRTTLVGLPPRGQALIGVGVAAAGLVGQVLAPSPRALVAGSMLVAVGLPVTMAPMASLIAEFAPTARASAFAVQSTVIYLGVAGGGAAAGLVGYAPLCLAATAALAVGVLPFILTVPASAGAPASHGALLAKPRVRALAVFSVVGAAGLVVLLGLSGQGGCGSACNGHAGVAQARVTSTGRPAAAAGATSTVPTTAGGSDSSGAVGTGGHGGSATPITSGIGTGAWTTWGPTRRTEPPTTGGSRAGTPPTTTLRAERTTTTATTAVSSTTTTSSASSTTAPSATTGPPSTGPTTTTMPPSATTTPATTAPTTTVSSSTEPPTSDSTPPSSSTRQGGPPRGSWLPAVASALRGGWRL